MSKTTTRYGQPHYRLSSTVEGNPAPSQKTLQQWAELDELSTKEFGVVYDKLSSKQKLSLHELKRTLDKQARERLQRKEYKVEARLDQYDDQERAQGNSTDVQEDYA